MQNKGVCAVVRGAANAQIQGRLVQLATSESDERTTQRGTGKSADRPTHGGLACHPPFATWKMMMLLMVATSGATAHADCVSRRQIQFVGFASHPPLARRLAPLRTHKPSPHSRRHFIQRHNMGCSPSLPVDETDRPCALPPPSMKVLPPAPRRAVVESPRVSIRDRPAAAAAAAATKTADHRRRARLRRLLLLRAARRRAQRQARRPRRAAPRRLVEGARRLVPLPQFGACERPRAVVVPRLGGARRRSRPPAGEEASRLRKRSSSHRHQRRPTTGAAAAAATAAAAESSSFPALRASSASSRAARASAGSVAR